MVLVHLVHKIIDLYLQPVEDFISLTWVLPLEQPHQLGLTEAVDQRVGHRTMALGDGLNLCNAFRDSQHSVRFFEQSYYEYLACGHPSNSVSRPVQKPLT